MKAVILAGGLGTRLAEETNVRPKPMVEIGGMPILWHIMKTYSLYGINDFIICAGYKGYVIKEFFSNYGLHTNDVTLNYRDGSIKYLSRRTEPWSVSIIDTGMSSNTGERLRRIRKYVDDEEFCLTYGDGLTDANLSNIIEFHKSRGRIATVTAVRPPARFGALQLDDDCVTRFVEKPIGESSYINGGYFVLSPSFFDYIDDENSTLEMRPLAKVADLGELSAFRHDGFWHPMDTLRDRQYLDSLITSGSAPWIKW